MMFGQFCGLIADQLGLYHSSFILSAELMFSSQEMQGKREDMPFALPARTVTTRDAAILVCLAAATDRGFSDPSEASEHAKDVIAEGHNLADVIQAIEEGREVALLLTGRFKTQITIPQSLIETISPLVRGGAIAHLRPV